MPTAQLNPEWDIQLNESLFPSADEKLYVLLEPTLWSGWEETLSEGESVPLFANTRFAALGNGPVLAEVVSKQTLESVKSHLEMTPSGSLLFTPSSMDMASVAESLRRRLVVQHGKTQAMMRFYEPRKLVSLIGSMTSHQRQQFFPSLTRIQWFDRDWLDASWHMLEQSQNTPSIWDLTSSQTQLMNLISAHWQGVNA
ncbi:DUF4123 domain-containing protein [Vibrio parahaemolyticus]|nr:DUF4123 domain-containing protein [Vibrio parahaemolyticus]EGR4673030.1 DUF4123 domain-containing protein [Vibrio parahaemolyticus]EHU4958948.1 DUF4123 domain-containing protein [Vibrio parahaemolyticus]EJG0654916.1 DUF4123 domain-containing protein [Vibrio parahaemolyticus]EJG0769620.1 DUF4123 domain-containing protein [Vibrio parahaemolyticus]